MELIVLDFLKVLHLFAIWKNKQCHASPMRWKDKRTMESREWMHIMLPCTEVRMPQKTLSTYNVQALRRRFCSGTDSLVGLHHHTLPSQLHPAPCLHSRTAITVKQCQQKNISVTSMKSMIMSKTGNVDIGQDKCNIVWDYMGATENWPLRARLRTERNQYVSCQTALTCSNYCYASSAITSEILVSIRRS